jgi:hypothetical protein
MKEELISFECAKLAKEKGFNQNPYETRNSYRPRFSDGSEIHLSDSLFAPEYNICVVPTQSLLQRWLREEYKISVLPSFNDNSSDEYYYFIHTNTSKPYSNRICSLPSRYNAYEQALEAGLLEALKLITD